MQQLNDDKDIPTLEELMTDMVREDYALVRKMRQQQLRHRIASGIVAGLYLLLAIASGSSESVVRLAFFLVLPLGAIWFSDELGSLTGVRFGRMSGPVITTATPGSIVRIGGWILLLAPIAGVIFGRLLYD